METAIAEHQNGTLQQTQTQTPESVFSVKLFDHAQRVAKMLSSSSLIPKEFQGNIQNTMIALEMANRVGASPLMVMQNLYIVHGKPGWSSQFVIASINTCGRFKSLRFDVSGEGMDKKCVAWTVEKSVALPDKIRTLEQAKDADIPVLEGVEVSMKMAKDEGWIDKNGSKWKTMPDVMLRYRAATFFGRMHCPEIMMGMKTQDEIIDIEAIPVSEPERVDISHEQLKELYEQKLPLLTKSEMDSAKRILEGKEENSYKKLYQTLIAIEDEPQS